MGTLLIAVGTFVAYLIAYNTYGKWLSRRVFRLDPRAVTPSVELNDGKDYVPTPLAMPSDSKRRKSSGRRPKRASNQDTPTAEAVPRPDSGNPRRSPPRPSVPRSNAGTGSAPTPSQPPA